MSHHHYAVMPASRGRRRAKAQPHPWDDHFTGRHPLKTPQLACFKQRREQLGFEQTDLATLLNLDQGSVSNWENGKHAWPAARLVTLCELYHVPDWLTALGLEHTPSALPRHEVHRRLRRLASERIHAGFKDTPWPVCQQLWLLLATGFEAHHVPRSHPEQFLRAVAWGLVTPPEPPPLPACPEGKSEH